MAEQLTANDDIREAVRERYAKAAESVGEGRVACCGPSDPTGGSVAVGPMSRTPAKERPSALSSTRSTIATSSPTPPSSPRWAAATRRRSPSFNEGETVLDLGSGGGIDVLLSARRVGPTGKAYGLDMTDEMLELARRNQREAGVENVEFLKGTIEEVPLPDDSVDVIISNCVINLSADKPSVFREAARVLRPGGRFAVTDIVADADMDEETRRDMAQWTGCIAGALTEEEFRVRARGAGFEQVEVRETHRVHDQAGSAIIRASVPA